ncbi:MAG: glycoside hydrolase family 25 protein, partial [Chloroflexota bacterium]
FANMTEGIDISHWQGAIDWTKVAAAGKQFAFMKASESTDYTDPTYVWNRQQARANGLYVGAYHFAQPSTEIGDAIAEADHFLITATPASGDLLPVLDLERSGGLSQAALTTWVQAYVGRIFERTGVHAMIYVSPNFWKNYMGDTTWFAINGFNILWVAHWTTATEPLVPAQNWGGGGWTFWQYTSDGTVPGIGGRVDLDRYRFTNFSKVRIP